MFDFSISLLGTNLASNHHNKSTNTNLFTLGSDQIKSMKMIAGEFFSASSNAFLKLLSPSPADHWGILDTLFQHSLVVFSCPSIVGIRLGWQPG